MDFFETIMFPFKWFVSIIMVGFHEGLSFIGLPAANGWTWTLSIIGLVLVIRAALIPVFVKQIKAQRGMQLLQPDLKKLQDQVQGQDRSALPPGHGAGADGPVQEARHQPVLCLPADADPDAVLLRAVPGVCPASAPPRQGCRYWCHEPRTGCGVRSARASSGLHCLRCYCATTPGNVAVWTVLTIVMILAMTASQFITQKQIMAKNMSEEAMASPFMRQQKMMLYILPIVFGVGGINFPIGVLIYWTTTNLWTMGQQFFVIRRMPTPGSPAAKALAERRAAKGLPPAHSGREKGRRRCGSKLRPRRSSEQTGQRVQPQRKNRKKK
jgi:YidC/Oxa1 family membrane protein insertase